MMFSTLKVGVVAAALAVIPVTTSCAQQKGPAGEDLSVHSFSPRIVPATDAMIQTLKLPAGFSISVFARDLGDARMLEVDADGTVYLTEPDEGRVIALKDNDGDGRADTRMVLFRDLDNVHGLRLHQGKMYLANPTTVWVVERDGNAWGQPRVVLSNMPNVRSHSNRTIGFDPQGKMYVSIGSSCNICVERNAELATIIRANADGSQREVFAKGLRNTIGFAWHPQTKEMWGMDHGSDMIGNDRPPEELNQLLAGKDYGWPYCWGKREVHPRMSEPPQGSKAEFCPKTEPMALGYQAHSSPIAMIFYDAGQFPAEYKGDAFVAFRGSWNRNPPSGYKIVRIKFENGKPTRFEDFVSGFLVDGGQATFGRPAGLAVAKDGSLLFTDDSNGVIYRVAYGKAAGTTTKKK